MKKNENYKEGEDVKEKLYRDRRTVERKTLEG